MAKSWEPRMKSRHLLHCSGATYWMPLDLARENGRVCHWFSMLAGTLLLAGCLASPPKQLGADASASVSQSERAASAGQVPRSRTAPQTRDTATELGIACAAPTLVEQVGSVADSDAATSFQRTAQEVTRLRTAREQWNSQVFRAKGQTLSLGAPAPGFGCRNPALSVADSPGRYIAGHPQADPDCVPGYDQKLPVLPLVTDLVRARSVLAKNVASLRQTDRDLAAAEVAAANALVNAYSKVVQLAGAGNRPPPKTAELAIMASLGPEVVDVCLRSISHVPNSALMSFRAAASAAESYVQQAMAVLAPSIAERLTPITNRAEQEALFDELVPSAELRKIALGHPAIAAEWEKGRIRWVAAEEAARRAADAIPEARMVRPASRDTSAALGQDGRDQRFPCLFEVTEAQHEIGRARGLTRGTLLADPVNRRLFELQSYLRDTRDPDNRSASSNVMTRDLVAWVEQLQSPSARLTDAANCLLSATQPHDSRGIIEAFLLDRKLKEQGSGNPALRVESMARLRKVADQGSGYASMLLASHLMRRQATAEDLKSAVQYLTRAAEQFRMLPADQLPPSREQPLLQTRVYKPLFAILTGQVPGARDLVLARKLFDEHHDQLDPAFRQSLITAIPGTKEIAERYARAAAEAEERRQRAESERLTREVARSRWDRCFRDNFDSSYHGWPVEPRIRAISSFVVNQTCGPMPSR